MTGTAVTKRRGFTLIELLVVISIIALLMSILMPALGRVKKNAKVVICQANLHQWALMWKFFTDDRDGKFMSRGNAVYWWIEAERYYADRKMLLCPMAERSRAEGAVNPYGGWDDETEDGDYYKGSYAINLWISDEDGEHKGINNGFWRTPNVKLAYMTPISGDSDWKDGDPLHVDEPPEHEQDWWEENANEIKRFIVNRHNGYTNNLFLDWSVRKVGLKEHYKLKWHREFDTNGPWTLAGGMTRADWENHGDGWLANFKDY